MAKIILLTDRSSQVTHLNCNRAGYWASVYGGSGIQPVKAAIPLVTGSAVHGGVQAILAGQEWDRVEATIKEEFDKANLLVEVGTPKAFAQREQQDLAIAQSRVWWLERWPTFREEYNVLAIEPEIRTVLYETDQYQVVLMSRPDAIIERKSDGALVMWELKTKAYFNDNWLKSWEHNLQLQAQTLAIKQWANDNGLADRLIAGCMVETLFKGQRKKDEKSGLYQQSTNLIYAYVKAGDGQLIPDQVSLSWKKGWEKRLVSETQSLIQWVDELPPEERATKCLVVPIISPSDDELKSAQVQWGEVVIRRHRSSVPHVMGDYDLDSNFPMNTSFCYQYGPCPFLSACFDTNVNADPLASGIYKVREPNHPEGLED